MEGNSFFEQATAGMSTAAVVLLSYMAFKINGIDALTKKLERAVNRLSGRVQTLSTKAGLGELETD